MQIEPAAPRLSDPVPPPANRATRRSDPPRVATTLLVARLITGFGEHICRVRNIGAGGIMVENEAALAVGDRVRIALHEMAGTDARVIWTEASRAGLAFDVPIDVDAVLRARAGRRGRRLRGPRFAMTDTVSLTHQGQKVACTLRDLSQGGCRLAIDQAPPVAGIVRIAIPGLSARPAAVRWAFDGEAGFAFQDMMSFAELAAWQRYRVDLCRIANPMAASATSTLVQ